MHALIVYAHPEPSSFTGALKDTAARVLRGAGHTVEISDLYAEDFNPVAGRHDFTTFRSAHCQADSPVRTLDRLDVAREGDRIVIHASARSFLHHQVRSMVGCLGLVGQGKWSADDLRNALEATDRAALGLNAPPDGLFFVRADYP